MSEQSGSDRELRRRQPESDPTAEAIFSSICLVSVDMAARFLKF